MKRILLCLCLLFIAPSIYASHYMGGEITWKTDSLHRYIFEVKFYRDCNGVAASNAINLVSNAVPGGILCNLTVVNDLSPTGGPACPTCLQPNGWQTAVQEHIYHSAPTILPSTVPVNGFYFEFNDCCRNATTNLSSTGSGNFTLRALMFADGPGNTLTGTDDSPKFMVSPSLGICPGDYIAFSHAAYDPELDSLAFEWGKPLDGSYVNGNFPPAYQFAAGFAYNNPTPDSSFDSSNVAATMDKRGMISFVSYTPGAFLMVVKVSSYKNGIKTAEIYREIEVTVASSCLLSLPPGASNRSPTIVPPANMVQVTGFNFEDTVDIGTSVYYIISTYDFDFNSTGMQEVELTSYSPHYGTGYTDSLNGCLIAPCATLHPPGINAGPGTRGDTLRFTASCAHASFIDGVLQHQREYGFTFKAKDNFCPTNGVKFTTLNLIVRGPRILAIGTDLYIPNATGYTIQWYLDGVLIPGATDTIVDASAPGIYSAITTMPGGCEMVTNAVARTTSSGVTENKPGNIENVYVDENKNLQIIFTSTRNMQMSFDILTLDGRIIKSFNASVTAGAQHLGFQAGDLQTGVYLLSVNGTAGKKFLVK